MYIRYFVYFLLLSAIVACENNPDKIELDNAERIMEIDNNPRECLNLLQHMNYDSIATEKQKARYGYLYARSKHKLFQIMDSVRYIKQSVEYYRSKGDSPELMSALFYYSNYYYEKDLNNEAIKRVMKARQLAIKYNDDYWRGKIAELIADILEHSNNNYEAVKYRNESAKYYSKAGREDNARYCYVDLAIAYNDIHDYDKCLELVDSIKNIAELQTDSVLLAYCYSTVYNAHIGNKDWEKCEIALNKFFSLSKFMSPKPYDYIYKAMILTQKNEYDSAEIALNQVKNQKMTDNEKITFYQTLRNFYKRKKNYEKALV
ncbi:MAG: hypothetical protein K2I94_01210, partial [Muribaculaceae bacterium]|nr:hypothetical protein [Muribaculaceae bacterium]